MAQTAFNKDVREIRNDVETTIVKRFKEAIQSGRRLEGVKEKDIRVARRIQIGNVGFPAVYIMRENYTTEEIGGHKVMLNLNYAVIPIAFNYDPKKAEDKAEELADNIFDEMLLKDRSFDEKIYDVEHILTSPTFQHPEKEGAFWMECRFNVKVIKQLG